MLCFFFTLNKKNVIHPDFFHSINGTFILELLTELLKICKSHITEQCFAGMDTRSQCGKVLAIIGIFYARPIYRQIFQEIFEDSFCVYSIAFE